MSKCENTFSHAFPLSFACPCFGHSTPVKFPQFSERRLNGSFPSIPVPRHHNHRPPSTGTGESPAALLSRASQWSLCLFPPRTIPGMAPPSHTCTQAFFLGSNLGCSPFPTSVKGLSSLRISVRCPCACAQCRLSPVACVAQCTVAW